MCRHCGSVARLSDAGRHLPARALPMPGLRERSSPSPSGTIFEDSHLPLAKWVKAFHLMASSKKGMSALQLQRNLGTRVVPYRVVHWPIGFGRPCGASQRPGCSRARSKWMRRTSAASRARARGRTSAGAAPARPPSSCWWNGTATPTVARFERVDAKTLKGAILECVDRSATINTDDLSSYTGIGASFAGGHQTVNHSAGQYVGPNGQCTNTAESLLRPAQARRLWDVPPRQQEAPSPLLR